MSNNLTRRSFFAASLLAGAGVAGGAIAGCAPQHSSEGKSPLGESGAKVDEFPPVVEPVDESLIVETHECDVAVVGLGVAGVAATRSAAEAGLNVFAVEKCAKPNARSSMFTAFNTENARKLGVEDQDSAALANEYMIQMCHRADYRVVKQWLDHCGEAFDWYAGAYEGLVWVSSPEEYPADESQIYVANFELYEPEKSYQYGRDHEKVIGACLSFGPAEHTPVLEANLEKAQLEGGAQVAFNCPARYLETEDGRITGVVYENLQDGTYGRVRAARGVVLATGGYGHNDELMERYAPWIMENQECYVYSYAHTDANGDFADTGDGHLMGLQVGARVDTHPHAVMAHSCLGALGVDAFLLVNDRGERFANEDLTTTHFSQLLMAQPHQKAIQVLDGRWAEQLAAMQPGLGNATSVDYLAMMYGPDESAWFSASADTLEELASQVGLGEEETATFLAEIERYNELCAQGRDDDFGKTAERLFPVSTPPFHAIVCDANAPGSADDVTCMRLLTTLSGLVTNRYAEVLDGDGSPIPGLYAIGNVQGGRFVDDYPTTISGASHAAALTYGYLVGKRIAETA